MTSLTPSCPLPSFGTRLSKDETDAVLAYVIKRANDEKAAQEAAAKKAN